MTPKKVVHIILGFAMVLAGLAFLFNLTRAVTAPHPVKDALRKQAMKSLWLTVGIVGVYMVWLLIVFWGGL